MNHYPDHLVWVLILALGVFVICLWRVGDRVRYLTRLIEVAGEGPLHGDEVKTWLLKRLKEKPE